ncbi:MAG: integrase [Granulosicoccus sp.]|jgi:integrase
MSYTIRSFIASDGERLSQLYDAQVGGFPLYYPTAYISRSVRPSATHNTQKVHLEALKRVCEWESNQDFVIAIRLQKQEFLNNQEIESLTRHIGKRRKGNDGEVIGRDKYNTYVAYAADYISWLANEVITETNISSVHSLIKRQHKAMLSKLARKAGSRSARRQQFVAMHLPKETQLALVKLFKNPFVSITRLSDKGPRLRNVAMLRVLYETGIRRGELLSLKFSALQESSGGEGAFLLIERNHHDEFDSRVSQPVAKTLGRIVPISIEAETLLLEYRDQWRAELPGIGFSNNDFLFVSHRTGRFQGEPVTETGFNSALTNLKKSIPELDALHPHLLRHDWNYRFSQKVDSEGWDFEAEREVREKLMGWVPNSNMSLLYNQRHIQEKANKIGLQVASDTERPDSKNED